MRQIYVRRCLAVLAVLAMLLTFVACGKPEPVASADKPTESTTVSASDAPASTTTADTTVTSETASTDGSSSSSTVTSQTETTTVKTDATSSSASSTTTSSTTKTTTTTKTMKETTGRSTSKSTTTTVKVTAKPITTTANPAAGKKVIVCWGDSITQGAWIEPGTGKKYPDQLQKMVGNEYMVWNAGYAGDTSYAVMARQGAATLKTGKAITFAAGETTVVIGHSKNGSGLLMDDGTEFKVMNISQTSWDTMLDFNPVYINGQRYVLGYKNKVDSTNYSITLTRETLDSLTIPAGSALRLSGSELAQTSYCNVYFAGANDSLNTRPSAEKDAAYIERIKKMVARGGERYLVVMPHWTAKYDAMFKEAFGDHAISFRELAIQKGLETEGLTPTNTDLSMMAEGKFPLSLRYNNSYSEIHLNEYGYHFFAKLVYDQGKLLGYWD